MKTNFLMKRWVLSLIIILMGHSLFAQQITGKVVDENNSPLPGVNVVEKGTSNGTITDVKGKYSIKLEGTNPVLQFSFVGYNTEDVTVGDKTTIDISLIPTLSELDEVVVVGYGSVKRRDLTGPVASVSASQLKDIPVTSTAQALTGRLAGVQITTTEGSPDAEVKIRVRGGGSITQDNSPLYIVDGFPTDDISSIAPTDIASIDVLKDASSTAIYGSRGANGVVIITTKSGEAGRTTVNYNFYTGYKKLANKLDVLSPYEFVLYQYERAQNNYLDLKSFQTQFGTWNQLDSLYGGVQGTDWQEKVFGQQAPMTYHNLSVSGGNKTSKFNLSLTHNDDKGIMLGSGYTRNNMNFKFETNATDKLTVAFDARLSDQKIRGAGTSDPGTSSANRLKNTVQYRPVKGLAVDPSQIIDQEEYYNLSNLTNPVDLTNDEYRNRHRTYATFNGSMTYEIINDLKVRTELGFENHQQRDEEFYGLSTYTARKYGKKPVVDLSENRNVRLRWANTATYSKSKLNGVHDITILLGQELYTNNTQDFSQESRSFPEDITPQVAIGSISLGAENQLPHTYEGGNKFLSFFGRANYGYKDKYLAKFTLRADGTTKFGPKNRWGYFPSASVAWRISEEGFYNIGFINSMKLRASYGAAGNVRMDDYLWTTTFGVYTDNAYYLNEVPVPYFSPSTLANPNLKWETTITRDLGLDLSFAQGRVNANIDVYNNLTRDLLIKSRIPSSSGYEEQMQNIGKTRNYGLEFALDAYIIERKDFRLSANFNISFNRNKVLELGNDMKSFTQGSDWSNDTGDDYMVKVGEPVGLMYGFVTDGYYTVDDFNYDEATQTYTLKDGVADNSGITFAGPSFGPGSLKFKNFKDTEVDKDGNVIKDAVTFADDRVVIGNANPKHIGGMNLMMNYKGLDMSVFLNWVYGNDIYNANKIEFTSGYWRYTNLLTTMSSDKRWRIVDAEGNHVTDPQQLKELNKNAVIWAPPQGRNLFHSWSVEDGSFLRINNITLGYTLPKHVSQFIKINKIRVYGTINNVYTFTNYSGYDPEVDTRRSTPLTPGVDYSAYPRSRSYLLGLNVSF